MNLRGLKRFVYEMLVFSFGQQNGEMRGIAGNWDFLIRFLRFLHISLKMRTVAKGPL